jgi:hypothetical protein
MRGALAALVVLLTVSLTAQRPIVPPPQSPIPEPKSRLRATPHTIVVQGCVQNGRLKIADSVARELPFDALNVSEFILEGPKELLRQIQEEHKGHYDEIAGVATVPPPPQDEDAAVVTSKKGPIQITAGRRDEKAFGTKNAPQMIRLRVASLTHINAGCVARH